MSTSRFQHGDWEFVKCDGPLSSLPIVEEFEKRTGAKVPEISFLHNFLKVRHTKSGKVFAFTPQQALQDTLHSRIAQCPESLRPSAVEVKDAGLWKDVKEFKIDFGCDWCHTSVYRGHMFLLDAAESLEIPTYPVCMLHALEMKVKDAEVGSGGSNITKDIECLCNASTSATEQAFEQVFSCDSVATDAISCDNASSNASSNVISTHIPCFQPTDLQIDYDLLRRRDPILHYTSTTLYEDELHDNGVAQMSVRSRVMPTCWFVLLRFFLRVDNVLLRIREVRIFHKHGTDHVLRETRLIEIPLQSTDNMRNYTNPDQLSANLQPHLSYTEILHL